MGPKSGQIETTRTYYFSILLLGLVTSIMPKLLNQNIFPWKWSRTRVCQFHTDAAKGGKLLYTIAWWQQAILWTLASEMPESRQKGWLEDTERKGITWKFCQNKIPIMWNYCSSLQSVCLKNGDEYLVWKIITSFKMCFPYTLSSFIKNMKNFR